MKMVCVCACVRVCVHVVRMKCFSLKLSYPTATKQLQTIVMNLVKESFGDSHYAKALECVKALREEAIKVITVSSKIIW